MLRICISKITDGTGFSEMLEVEDASPGRPSAVASSPGTAGWGAILLLLGF